MYNQALVANIMERCFTKKFTGYQLQKDQDSDCPLVFCDMMGLDDSGGVLVDDVRLLLDGHVKDGYKFKPDSKLSEDNSQFYNKSPTFSDKVHVLVCVVPANKGPNIVNEKTLLKIQDIRKEASSRGIPQLVLLTKIDQLCPEIQDDLENVYRLKSVKQKMEKFSAELGIPMNCIFPVKNYHEEINLDQEVDSLVLSAVRNIITAGGDYILENSSKYKSHSPLPPEASADSEHSIFMDVLGTPWRKINWTNIKEPLLYVKNYKSPVEGQKIRVLLCGPAGAGKSSYVNSIQSVLLGRMYNQALVDTTMGRCFTRKFTGYQVHKNEVSYCPLVFYDMMGLEDSGGVLVEDVRLVLDGHVKDGYKFNPDSKLSEDNKFYNKSPTFSDKVHVLVCVVPADKGPNIVKEKTLHKIQDIRKEASSRGIPQLVLLTKIDKLCPEIQDDLKNVYRLQSVKQKMEQFQADVGIPMNCIFPVKNYHEEIDLDDKVDSLLLSAVRNIITAGGDYNRKKSRKEKLQDFM